MCVVVVLVSAFCLPKKNESSSERPPNPTQPNQPTVTTTDCSPPPFVVVVVVVVVVVAAAVVSACRDRPKPRSARVRVRLSAARHIFGTTTSSLRLPRARMSCIHPSKRQHADTHSSDETPASYHLISVAKVAWTNNRRCYETTTHTLPTHTMP